MLVHRTGILLLLATRLWAVLRRRERPVEFAERIATGKGPPAGAGPVIWLHGASLGELAAARPLIDALLHSCRPDLHLLITCNSPSGRRMLEGWALERTTIRLAPADFARLSRRFLERWRPAALIVLENELWPERIIAASARGIPVLVLGARLSKRSARMWRRLGGLSRRMFGALSRVYPLDEENGARICTLGLAPENLRAPLNLKLLVAPPPPDPQQLARLAASLPRQHTILAASTHSEEDEALIAAFARAHVARPELRMIIAPRHTERGDAIEASARACQIALRRRSRNELPARDVPLYLADTQGEMPLFFSLAEISILGGSFVDRGGHTPVEPIRFDTLVIHGPHVQNHAGIYAALDAAGASVALASAGDLASWLANPPAPEEISRMTSRARRVLREHAARHADLEGLLNDLDAMATKRIFSSDETQPRAPHLADNGGES